MRMLQSRIRPERYWFTFSLLLAVLFQQGYAEEKGSEPAGTSVEVTAEEARAIAKDAYIYGFPIVMNYKTLYNFVIDEDSPEYKGPFNQLACLARLFTPEDKAVVTPNADTPYCMFWMDLRAEPVVLTLPELEPERFYHLQLIDLYTHNFAYLGTLTTGNGAGKYLIAGPDWDGEKPEGITDVIRSETGFVFDVTRTQLFGPEDLPRVKAIQSSYDLQPLSVFLGQATPAAAPPPDFPVWVEGSQFDERFFGYLDFMLSLLEKPLEVDKPLWNRLARLGIGPEHKFDFAALSAEIQDALKAGLDFDVSHAYGLTEVHGSAVICSWHEEWDLLSISEQAERKKRQDVRYPMLEELVVMDPETMTPVPRDGETIGEVMFRGNIVMKGYLKNPEAGAKAFAGGYFHSGDLAVCHPDGYIEIKDRSKDIIISGGENISSIEVEAVLYRHPAVMEAAVSAMPDEKWGETPCAFVTLRDDVGDVSEQDIHRFLSR